jgi:DNA polymerase-3 subunit beta
MKIVCSKSNLVAGLNIVSKAVPSKTTMSILECILIDCTEGNIKLIANDMDFGIETVVEGKILEKGVAAYDANILINIIRNLNDNDVTIETDSDFNTSITCEKNTFNNIASRSGEEFSYLPKVEMNDPIVLSKLTLKDVIRQTIFSISDNEANKMMGGELFEINGENLRVVSLDGHRISIRNIKMKSAYNNTKVIIPGKTLNEISKIISGNDEDDVNIYLNNNHVLFKFDNTTVVSRLIEGEYFKIDQMLSNDYETKISINKKELLNSISRATILIKEGDKKPVILNIADNNVNLSIKSVVGSMNEDIEINKEGKDLMIGFNPKFLIDALRVIDDENINIYLVNAKAPCFIRDESNSYIYLVLPVNFTTAG